MPHPLPFFSQSDYLIQFIDRNSHIEWQTVQIQISWLLQKPTDLDLHCLQRQGISRFSRTRVNFFITKNVHEITWVKPQSPSKVFLRHPKCTRISTKLDRIIPWEVLYQNCSKMATRAKNRINFKWRLENLFIPSSPEPKGQMTRNLVGSIGVTSRSKITKIVPVRNPR